MARVDISVVATFHREGALAVPTLKAIGLCRDAARAAGLRVEVVATLDRADQPTREIVRAWQRITEDTRVIELDVGDLGLARNAGFAEAAGKYGSTMDGDDLTSPGWLVRAYRTARLNASRSVVHPEYVIEFGAGCGFTRLRGMRPSSERRWALLAAHPWTSCSFAPLQAYRESPYLGSTGRWSGFGFEDWQWNAEQLAKGRSHVVAPRTFLLYRKRADSLLAAQLREHRLVGPLELFAPERVLSASATVSINPSEPTASHGGEIQAAPRPPGRIKRLFSQLAGGSRNGAVPFWARRELRTLSRYDSSVPATNTALRALRHWEPRLNPSVGVCYAHVVRELWIPEAGRMAAFALVETLDGAKAAWAAGNEVAVTWPGKGIPCGGLQKETGRLIAPPCDLLDDEAETLLTRLLVQIRPPSLDFESTDKLRALAERHHAALRSLGVRVRLLESGEAQLNCTSIES